MTSKQPEALIEAMANGGSLTLVDDEIKGLLSWIAKSSRDRHAKALKAAFGEAEDGDSVVDRGFYLLDTALFQNQRLRQENAGVSESFSADERRLRYRLLLSAFHPDRYPSRSDWLTERSQIITRAYADFKSGADKIVYTRQIDTVISNSNAKPNAPGYRKNSWRLRAAAALRRRPRPAVVAAPLGGPARWGSRAVPAPLPGR